MVELFGKRQGRIYLIILIVLMAVNSVLDFMRWRDDVRVRRIVENQRKMLDARAEIQLRMWAALDKQSALSIEDKSRFDELMRVAEYDRVAF